MDFVINLSIIDELDEKKHKIIFHLKITMQALLDTYLRYAMANSLSVACVENLFILWVLPREWSRSILL
jgi:hypothetical protein